MITVTGKVFGIQEVNKALRQLPDDMRKELQKDINAPLNRVRSTARSRAKQVSMSGWQQRSWPRDGITLSGSKIASSITIKDIPKRSQKGEGIFGRRVMFSGRGAAGSIVELAGSGKSNNPQGLRFAAVLSRQLGRPSRVIWGAWDQLGAHDEITRDFELHIQAALDAFTKAR
jgi:hypothetical protein